MRKKTAVPVVFQYGRTKETREFRSGTEALAYAIDRSAYIATSWVIEWNCYDYEAGDYYRDGRRKVKGDI